MRLERFHFCKSDDGHDKQFHTKLIQREYPGVAKNASNNTILQFPIPNEVIAVYQHHGPQA